MGGQCSLNLALLLDGYLTGVFGYDPSYVTSAGAFGKDSSAVAIVYGMCVPRPDLRLNRLLSRLAMTRQSLSVVLPDIALARCDHLVTAQLTQYPEAKEYRGIMKLVKRKKDPHHGFRLIYNGPLMEETWDEILKLWFKDEERWRKASRKRQLQPA